MSTKCPSCGDQLPSGSSDCQRCLESAEYGNPKVIGVIREEVDSIVFPDRCANCQSIKLGKSVTIALDGFRERVLLIPYCSKHARPIRFHRRLNRFLAAFSKVVPVLVGVVAGLAAAYIFLKFHVFAAGSSRAILYAAIAVGFLLYVLTWGALTLVVSPFVKDLEKVEAVRVRPSDDPPLRYLFFLRNREFAEDFVTLNRTRLI